MAEITKEIYEQALNAQNADEIARIAESAGVKLEKSEAEALFARLRSADVEEVADEELDNVSGGCSYPPDPRTCPRCGSTDTTHFGSGNIADNGYLNMVCRDCEYCWRIM
ncbi:hypothetical protein QUW41_05400 [Slackia piriformis]|jgi:hypothetical protein|nr:hypothetical protein [Slackia piriformis]